MNEANYAAPLHLRKRGCGRVSRSVPRISPNSNPSRPHSTSYYRLYLGHRLNSPFFRWFSLQENDYFTSVPERWARFALDLFKALIQVTAFRLLGIGHLMHAISEEVVCWKYLNLVQLSFNCVTSNLCDVKIAWVFCSLAESSVSM